MKNIIGCLLALCALSLRSQTLTQAANEPIIGEVDICYRLDTSAYATGLPGAVTGTSCVWDFSKTSGAFPLVFDSILAVTAVPEGTAYPSASFVQKRGRILAFFKSSTSPAQTELVGASAPAPPLSITFTNTGIVASYPISYGYSSTDPVTGSFTYSNNTGVCNGTIKVVADGTGTLLLPGNVTFTNVLRVRSIEQLTMTLGFLPAGTINQSIFSYYVPGKKYPVIRVEYQKYQLLVGTPTITAAAYGNNSYFTVAGIGEESGPALRIFPNPFNDVLNVTEDAEVTQYHLRDALGGEVPIRFNKGQARTTDLPTGIYFLEKHSSAGVSRSKIVKQ